MKTKLVSHPIQQAMVRSNNMQRLLLNGPRCLRGRSFYGTTDPLQSDWLAQ